jgi:predicted  nucleic acid-binding Zn-ribbon protein
MNFKTMMSTCLLVMVPIAVQAQTPGKIYMCKDATGKTITSDRPIPECADRAVKELDSSGRTRREVGPPPTPEEIKQAKLDQEKKKLDAIAAAEQKRNDLAIMSRFRSEDDIAVARKRTVDLVQDQIKRETTSLHGLEKRKKDVAAQIPAAKGKTEVLAGLNRQIEEADQGIKDTKKKIQDYEAEAAQINAKFDATLKRYRELNAAAAAANK